MSVNGQPSGRLVTKWPPAGLGGRRRAPAGLEGAEAARCRLSEDQLAELDRVLDAGPRPPGGRTSGGRWPGSGT
jgi:hypothetical protein